MLTVPAAKEEKFHDVRMGQRFSPGTFARSTVRIAAVLLCVSVSAVSAQRTDRYWSALTLGETIGSQVGTALSSAAALRAKAIEASEAIQSSRLRYWRALASGTDVEAAHAEFAARLWEKDLVYLTLAVPEGINGPLAVVIGRLANIDGGVRPSAQEAFGRWVNRIRFHLGASSRGHIMPGLSQLAGAMALAHEEQALYLRARDWAEITAAGLTFPWDESAREHGIMLLQRYGPLRTLDQAREWYNALVSLIGEARVLDAADRVRRARRNAEGALAAPASLGVTATMPLDAFTELLVATSGAAWLMHEDLRKGRTVSQARANAQRVEWAFSEAAVNAAANHLRRAGRDATGRFVPPERFASRDVVLSGDIGRAILGILALDDLQGWARLLAGLEAQSPTDAAAAWRALTQKYTDQKVLAAADTLRMFLFTVHYSGSPRTRDRWVEHERARGSSLLPRTDQEMLVRILDTGSGSALGDPGARTADERAALEAVNSGVPEWERGSYLFFSRWERIASRVREDTTRHPDSAWLIVLGTQLRDVASHYRNPTWVAGRNLRGDRLRALYLNEAFKTLQVHCATSGAPEGDACALLKLTEDAYADIWPRLPEGFRERPNEATGSGLRDLVGVWTGQARVLTVTGGRYPLRLRFSIPTRGGEPFATMEYPAMPCAVQYFFLKVAGGEYYFTERNPNPPGRCGTGISGVKITADGSSLHWLWYQRMDQLPYIYGPDVFGTPTATAAASLQRSR
jgi:hypothetical protein